MLPTAIRTNMDLCRDQFSELNEILFCRPSATEFLDHIERLCDRLHLPRRLSEVGVLAEQIPAIVKDSRGSSMSGNPRELADDELTAILEGLL
jgi:alcohol dehydrogenase class IV